mgnify:CR=1 FL=1
MFAGHAHELGRHYELAEAEYVVRAHGYLQSLEDFNSIPVGLGESGTPILLRDVATGLGGDLVTQATMPGTDGTLDDINSSGDVLVYRRRAGFGGTAWLYDPGYMKNLAGWGQAMTTGLPLAIQRSMPGIMAGGTLPRPIAAMTSVKSSCS